jgi:hypothetical protein
VDDGYGDCYMNSPAISVPSQPLSNLHNLSISGTAGASGDGVVLGVTGTMPEILYVATNDNVLGLNTWWTTAEFNVFGFGNLNKLEFDPGTTIVVNLTTGSTEMPFDVGKSFTGESNNLNRVGPACQFGGNPAGLQWVESNDPNATPLPCPYLGAFTAVNLF